MITAKEAAKLAESELQKREITQKALHDLSEYIKEIAKNGGKQGYINIKGDSAEYLYDILKKFGYEVIDDNCPYYKILKW